MVKRTTTLTLDTEIVEKAKKMGINISELTENVLRGFTFEPKSGDKKSLNKKYNELFETIKPILKNQGISVVVGNEWTTVESINKHGKKYSESMPIGDILLCPDGDFFLNGPEVILESIEEDENLSFLRPKEILSNLITAIEEGKNRNKEMIRDIELIKRITEAIYPSIVKNNRSISKKTKGSRKE